MTWYKQLSFTSVDWSQLIKFSYSGKLCAIQIEFLETCNSLLDVMDVLCMSCSFQTVKQNDHNLFVLYVYCMHSSCSLTLRYASHQRRWRYNCALQRLAWTNTVFLPCPWRPFCLSSWIILLFHVHGSMHHESMRIIVQQNATMYSLLNFCKLLTLHVLGGNSTHYQEHT